MESETTATPARALSVVSVHHAMHLDLCLLPLCRKMEIRRMRKGQTMSNFVTWKPVRSIFFTLIKMPSDTLIFCHSNEEIYFTPPHLKLGGDCIPDYTGILCQWCEDVMPGGQVEPHLLMFDVLPAEPGQPEAAFERGERLRQMVKDFPEPLCHLQWNGFREALEKVLLPTLPHAVEGLLVLSDDPLRPFFLPLAEEGPARCI